MKIPKKMRMFGYDWKIKITDKSEGSFVWKTKTIEIGDKYGEKEAILLHEIMEAIFVELHMRYTGMEGNMPYTFHFDHTEFCKFHKSLYQILKDNKMI